ncbi:MAG: hypothetical protein R2712_12370 [Vicinamibacterales bacterium]
MSLRISSAFSTTCASESQILVLVGDEVVDRDVTRLTVAVDAPFRCSSREGFHGQSKCSR